MFFVPSSAFDWQIQHHAGNISPWQPYTGWWEKQLLQNRETKASGKPHNAFFVRMYVKFIVRSHLFLQLWEKAVIVEISHNGFEVTGVLAHLSRSTGCSKRQKERPSKAQETEVRKDIHVVSLYKAGYWAAVLPL